MEKMSNKIQFEQLTNYFHMPINQVSTELGVCATVLKKICRKHGITRWPHRKIKSLERMIKVLEMTAENAPENREQIRQEIELMKKQKEALTRAPNNPQQSLRAVPTIAKAHKSSKSASKKERSSKKENGAAKEKSQESASSLSPSSSIDASPSNSPPSSAASSPPQGAPQQSVLPYSTGPSFSLMMPSPSSSLGTAPLNHVEKQMADVMSSYHPTATIAPSFDMNGINKSLSFHKKKRPSKAPEQITATTTTSNAPLPLASIISQHPLSSTNIIPPITSFQPPLTNPLRDCRALVSPALSNILECIPSVSHQIGFPQQPFQLSGSGGAAHSFSTSRLLPAPSSSEPFTILRPTNSEPQLTTSSLSLSQTTQMELSEPQTSTEINWRFVQKNKKPTS